MLFKQYLTGASLFALTTIGLSFLSPAYAQMSEQEFQMGRAREACTNQSRNQGLTVNRVISTKPINGSGGRMIGSDVILNVSRQGSTYDVQCRYDNVSRGATISSISNQSSQTGKPVPITYAPARSCLAAVGSKIRQGYAGVEKLNFSSDTTRSYFISNAEQGIRGQGQFYQSRGTWYRFGYDCKVNTRSGQVVSATYNVL